MPNLEPLRLTHLDPVQRERLIRRYCRCGWVIADNDVDGDSRAMTHFNEECPLHSPKVKFDLPEVFP